MKWWDCIPWSSFFELSFKPAFSHSSFTFMKRLFNSYLLSAIRVVSSACLRLLIFLLAILMPACSSSSKAFHMMCSAYKLNKQGDNMQPWCTPFPIWNGPIFPCPVVTLASWPASGFLRRQLRRSVFPSPSERCTVCCDPHSQRLWQSQWSRSRCFSGTLLLFRWSNGCWQFDLCSLCLF